MLRGQWSHCFGWWSRRGNVESRRLLPHGLQVVTRHVVLSSESVVSALRPSGVRVEVAFFTMHV